MRHEGHGAGSPTARRDDLEAIGGRRPEPGMIAWFELTDVGREALGPTSLQPMPPGMSGYHSPGVVGGFR
ncbi:hypothetical protein [Brachybacterium fresconis]|uniref:Uncharacterized protein n=1 Tax=Brachybacterium fresconis TaxID=173363 RepID=A0ABS4YNM4_9MICO|nr:hypothetical protein [Brachybacterium fresconis]MBP2410007.1 hypothetical protein [Brachybacterium fresconis]